MAVVGASLSAVEIAAELAQSARSLGHVAPRPFWVLPRYVAADPGCASSPFMPLDLAFYRRGAPGPQHEVMAHAPADFARTHAAMRALSGGLEAHLPAALRAEPLQPPMVTISDAYAPMLAAGRITPRCGRVTSLAERSLTLASGERIDDVDAVVLCTGYRPDLSSCLMRCGRPCTGTRATPSCRCRRTARCSTPSCPTWRSWACTAAPALA